MENEKLITDNLNLIYDVLKKMNLYYKIDEYYDICLIGICKATKNFISDKGCSFSTYAYNCIQNEVLHYIKEKNAIKRQTNYNSISLNTTIYDSGSGTTITLEDTIASDTNLEEELIKKEQIQNLYIALSKLDKIEAEIITNLYGLNGVKKQKQRELCNKYNKSQTAISRIKKKAIKKLRKILKE